MVSQKNMALADLLFPETEKQQQDFADGVLSIPLEQRKLHTETYDFTVETLVDKLDSGSVFVPQFQRRYVWTDVQASRLIESLIIQCPIPVIYLNQEPDERLSVIDGNQRLTSIRRFISGEFGLKGLTAYPELDGNNFSDLDVRFQRHIVNRTLRCIVILKDTHPQVKFDVFERLNTGAAKLTPQELRHGMYYGDAITLAGRAVRDTDVLKILDIKSDKRMKTEELVLRFWSLDDGLKNYKKPLAGHINSFADANRSISEAKKQQYLSLFQNALGAVHELLGELAFKVFDKNLVVHSSFNAALFDALMVGTSSLLKEDKLKKITQKKAQLALAELLESDADFANSIGRATSDETQVRYRIGAIAGLFSK